MESLSEKPSLLERLQIAEYTAIQALTIRTAKRGHAVMCSGANLIVRREVWLACEPEIHPEIPSGDDMFLLEAVKRHGYRVSVLDTPDFMAVGRPLTSWRAFFRQRMRWAGKAPHYTDRDILRCGTFVLAMNLLQLLFPPFILITFPIGYSFIRTRFLDSLLLAILYPYYLFFCLLGGLFRKNKW
jgi:cellulose synthase/poly-beta-1,6-N-acetylglucosamine synthase-like glycosyltransferase